MKATMKLKADTYQRFRGRCAAAISHVGNGSRKALLAACEDIMEDSLAQVPYGTGALSRSLAYQITGDYKTGWNAIIAYGMYVNPINHKTHQPVSEYAAFVHENLNAYHPIGKAKFLEDPIRAYAQERFPRTIIKYTKDSFEHLQGSSYHV